MAEADEMTSPPHPDSKMTVQATSVDMRPRDDDIVFSSFNKPFELLGRPEARLTDPSTLVLARAPASRRGKPVTSPEFDGQIYG
jgi:hypothetical protein